MGLFSSRPQPELVPFQLKRGNVRARLHPRVGPELSSGWLAAPDALVPGHAPPPPWRGASPSGSFFVKSRVGSKGHRALARSFALGLELEARGLAVPVHLALVTRAKETWLIMERLEGQDLDVALATASPLRLEALGQATAALIADLHRAGFRQRDLKAPNLLVQENGPVALVDLEGVRPGASPRLREKDLGRLAASFMVLEERGLPPRAWTRLLERYLFLLRGSAVPEGQVLALNERTRARGTAKLAAHRRHGRPSR